MDAAIEKASSAIDALYKSPKNSVARRELLVALSQVKSCGREAFVHLEQQRKRVRERRVALDGHILSLQNLLYEREHLLRNISLCREFTTPQLQRLQEDEGEAVVKPMTATATSADHRANLLQLEQEKKERQRLGEQIESLRETLRARKDEASTTRRFLDTLPEQLKNIEDASLALQQTLGVPRSEVRAAHAQAEQLSRPLYLAYRQLDALRSLAIFPRTETETNEESTWTVGGAEVDLHVKNPLGTDDAPSGKRRRKSTEEDGGSARSSQHSGNLLLDDAFFTMTVEVGGEMSGEIAITFKAVLAFFFSEARKRTLLKVTVDEGDLVAADVLCNLFPGDLGEPLEDEKQGRMYEYSWVQYLCGLDALPLCNPSRGPGEATVLTSSDILAAIVDRLRFRAILEKILAHLQRGTFPLPIHTNAQSLFPTASKDKWTLSSWTETVPEGLREGKDPFRYETDLPETSIFEKWEFEKCRYFEAKFVRDQACLMALVEVSPEYPIRPPRVLLQGRSGENESSTFDQDLKHVEIEVNIYYDELLSEESADAGAAAFLLAHQLRRIQVCLDALTDGKSLNSARRGRDRRMAMLYRGDEGFEYR